MNLLDLLFLKSLINSVTSGGELTSEEAQKLWNELEKKVSREEMYEYVDVEIENLPSISQDELLNLLT